MRLEEPFILAILFLSAMVGLPWVTFALASLFRGFPRLRLSQILGIVGVWAWVFGFMNAVGPPFHSTGLLLFVTTVGVLLGFAGMWLREFPLLMARRSDEFPDRSDKLAWVFVLTAMAPAGVWLFRSYRRARWPEASKAALPHPLDDSEANAVVPELDRIGV